MTNFNRRTFLKTSALAAGTLAFSARSWAQVAGANGDVRVAVIGLNGRGKSHVSSLAAIKGVRIVALCDPDTAVLAKAKKLEGIDASSVKTYTDLRELFADKDVDAVTVATPNHWHSLAGIWACQAGKDVYVEKPISHNIWEGRQFAAAAKKYNRIIQAGTQIRSGEGMQEAVAWVRAGNLGKIICSRGLCYKRRDSIGKTVGPQPIPATINYDVWSGPAPVLPSRRNSKKNGSVHYEWHWFWPYGNGDVGNQGIHQMDVARWFLGEPGLPRHTFSIGGRVGYDDDGETPNTQVIVHDYKTAPLIFEVRGLPSGAGKGADVDTANMNSADAADAQAATMDKYHGASIGIVVECEGGMVVVPNYWSATAHDRDGKVIKEFKGHDRHMQNYIDVIRSRKAADQYGPIDEGHVSSALCHLGNISHQVGRTMSAGELAERTQGNNLTAEATGRMVEHLKAHRVDFTKTPLTLGATLTLADGKEQFTGEFSAAANPLLTRQYRAPFVVPALA
ncbi:MAG TPA: Gfo/Idh/MocA family oxidoreductase [Candidatus Acidoferrales bacterium]|jgi:predicted dehydrogenase|nr:Gfo/Idh/MocA family oxidoreductase [Candidatus Acidoferrales bacterium]